MKCLLEPCAALATPVLLGCLFEKAFAGPLKDVDDVHLPSDICESTVPLSGKLMAGKGCLLSLWLRYLYRKGESVVGRLRHFASYTKEFSASPRDDCKAAEQVEMHSTDGEVLQRIRVSPKQVFPPNDFLLISRCR